MTDEFICQCGGHPPRQVQITLTDQQRMTLRRGVPFVLQLTPEQITAVREAGMLDVPESALARGGVVRPSDHRKPRTSKDGKHSPELDSVGRVRCICTWRPPIPTNLADPNRDRRDAVELHIDRFDKGRTRPSDHIPSAATDHDAQMAALNRINEQIGGLAKAVGEEFTKALRRPMTNDDLAAVWRRNQMTTGKLLRQERERKAALEARAAAWHQHADQYGPPASKPSFFAGWAAARRWFGR